MRANWSSLEVRQNVRAQNPVADAATSHDRHEGDMACVQVGRCKRVVKVVGAVAEGTNARGTN